MVKEVIQNLGDDKVQAELMPLIEQCLSEVSDVLAGFPDDVSIYFFEQDSEHIIKEFGVGGYTYSKDILSLGWRLDYPDKEEQRRQLRSTIYHEGLHIAQGYTGSTETYPILHCAVYEGLATVFEREYAGVSQPYGDYSTESKDTILADIERLSEIGVSYDNAEYRDWAFTDRDSGERWRLYKVGVWIVDQVLAKHNRLTLLDLTKNTPTEVLDLLNGA